MTLGNKAMKPTKIQVHACGVQEPVSCFLKNESVARAYMVKSYEYPDGIVVWGLKVAKDEIEEPRNTRQIGGGRGRVAMALQYLRLTIQLEGVKVDRPYEDTHNNIGNQQG